MVESMPSKIYKYMGPEVLTKAFSDEDYCGLKCSYPKDFNDPYELFLTIDYQQDPELLAYYQDVVGKLPQLPTTCFSKSPIIIPMWAHYAHNHCGVVVEIDEEQITKHFPEIGFGDIDYIDQASDDLQSTLDRAYGIGKYRYHYMLQRGVFSAAYYTKHTCWSYEQERRLVAGENDVKDFKGMKILKLPIDCVTSLISGCNSTSDTEQIVSSLASKHGAEHYKMKIGKSSTNPYFVGSNDHSYEFKNGIISKCESYCVSCKEPTEETDVCPWCAIEEHHTKSAASQNPMRMLDRLGLLDQYYKDMNASSGKKK